MSLAEGCTATPEFLVEKQEQEREQEREQEQERRRLESEQPQHDQPVVPGADFATPREHLERNRTCIAGNAGSTGNAGVPDYVRWDGMNCRCQPGVGVQCRVLRGKSRYGVGWEPLG